MEQSQPMPNQQTATPMQNTKKSNNIAKIVASITSVIAVAGICFGIYGIIQSQSKNEQISNLGIQITDLKTQIENNGDKGQGDAIQTISFDVKKCLNSCDFSEQYSSRLSETYLHPNGVAITTKGNSAEFQVRYDLIFPDKYTEEDIMAGTVDYSDDVIIEFDKNVEMVFSGNFGTSFMDTVFFFLLNDGTIEYLKFSDISESRSFEPTPISGIDGIVRFDIVTTQIEPAGSETTTIAYKTDGSYYDLSEFVK